MTKESPAIKELMQEAEKNKKRAMVFYAVGMVLVFFSIFSFLLFGPVDVPLFSELGDNIIGEKINEESEKAVEVVEEIVEVKEEENKEQEETTPENEVSIEKEVSTPTTSISTPKSSPKPTYVCSDAEIQELEDGIAQLESYKKDTEDRINQFFFQCFDTLIEDYPNQSDQWYQDECAVIVCIDMYPELCSMPDEFQEGIDDFQSDLDYCLSDR